MILKFFKRLLSLDSKEESELRNKLSNILGFTPEDLTYYRRALTHKSVIEDNPSKRSNERLEYLGDSILGSCVSHHLFNQFPDADEGYLTQVRSRIVSRNNLNSLAGVLGIDKLIDSNIDKKQRINSVKGNAFEALIGAVYLDQGYTAAMDFVKHLIDQKLLDVEKLSTVNENYKSQVIEFCQKERKEIVFEVTNEEGNGYNKKFEVNCVIDSKVVGKGKGRSKKIAEQKASNEAIKFLKING